jgi:hypothetical protein
LWCKYHAAASAKQQVSTGLTQLDRLRAHNGVDACFGEDCVEVTVRTCTTEAASTCLLDGDRRRPVASDITERRDGVIIRTFRAFGDAAAAAAAAAESVDTGESAAVAPRRVAGAGASSYSMAVVIGDQPIMLHSTACRTYNTYTHTRGNNIQRLHTALLACTLQTGQRTAVFACRGGVHGRITLLETLAMRGC